jgi:hypothetical protein
VADAFLVGGFDGSTGIGGPAIAPGSDARDGFWLRLPPAGL